MNEEQPMRPQHYTKNYIVNKVKLGGREGIPREDQDNCLSRAKQSPKAGYISGYICMQIYICMHACTFMHTHKQLVINEAVKLKESEKWYIRGF